MAPRKHIDRDELIRLRDSGKTLKEIGEILGINQSSVSYHIRNRSVSRKIGTEMLERGKAVVEDYARYKRPGMLQYLSEKTGIQKPRLCHMVNGISPIHSEANLAKIEAAMLEWKTENGKLG